MPGAVANSGVGVCDRRRPAGGAIPAWQLQLVLFGALGVLAIFLWRRFRPENNETTDQPMLNQRGVKYVGQVFQLFEPVKDGTGKIRVGDGVWLVRGADCRFSVRVIGVEGAVLRVERA